MIIVSSYKDLADEHAFLCWLNGLSVSSMENYITSTSILLDKNKAQSESTDSSSPNVVFHYASPSQGEKGEKIFEEKNNDTGRQIIQNCVLAGKVVFWL